MGAPLYTWMPWMWCALRRVGCDGGQGVCSCAAAWHRKCLFLPKAGRGMAAFRFLAPYVYSSSFTRLWPNTMSAPDSTKSCASRCIALDGRHSQLGPLRSGEAGREAAGVNGKQRRGRTAHGSQMGADELGVSSTPNAAGKRPPVDEHDRQVGPCRACRRQLLAKRVWAVVLRIDVVYAGPLLGGRPLRKVVCKRMGRDAQGLGLVGRVEVVGAKVVAAPCCSQPRPTNSGMLRVASSRHPSAQHTRPVHRTRVGKEGQAQARSFQDGWPGRLRWPAHPCKRNASCR